MSDLASRLLAGKDRLSRIEKEQILDAVLAQAAPAPRRRWWLAVVPALAAAALLIVITPWKHDDFTARGGGAPVAMFEPSAHAGKLVFDVHGTTGYGYVAAFAQRADGTILWYFPASETGTSAPLHMIDGVLDRSIAMGSEHTPGTYRVYGVFSRAPLTRDQVRAQIEGMPRGDVAVVQRELTLP